MAVANEVGEGSRVTVYWTVEVKASFVYVPRKRVSEVSPKSTESGGIFRVALGVAPGYTTRVAC